jgi:hypothetical protein
MSELKTGDRIALRLIMNEDIYLVNDKIIQDHAAVSEPQDIVSLKAYNYLGGNDKRILIIVDQAGDEIIRTEALNDLKNILSAKQLGLRDVAILNRAHYPHGSFDSLKNFFACKKLILFGISSTELGLPVVSGNTITLVDETKILASYSFDEMHNDRNKKVQFWNAMKEL